MVARRQDEQRARERGPRGGSAPRAKQQGTCRPRGLQNPWFGARCEPATPRWGVLPSPRTQLGESFSASGNTSSSVESSCAQEVCKAPTPYFDPLASCSQRGLLRPTLHEGRAGAAWPLVLPRGFGPLRAWVASASASRVGRDAWRGPAGRSPARPARARRARVAQTGTGARAPERRARALQG